MPRIIPLRELNNASGISKLCHELNDPIFVTKNGKSDMVILSSDAYDKLTQNQIRPVVYSIPNSEELCSEESTLEQYMHSRDSKPLYSIAELKKVLTPIFQRHDVKRATLFGSYVKGTATTRSDVDLMVDTHYAGLDFYGLLADVSEALRFPVDLIEKRQIEKGSEMEKEIEDTGVTIYG